MRQRLILVAVLICGCLLGVSSERAAADPLPTIAAPALAPAPIEKAGWRRNCRRYGCVPDIVLPGADVDVGVGVDLNVDVGVDPDVPVIVVLPPPRPLSCGQYRYWNGERCVDARYHDPYIGPR